MQPHDNASDSPPAVTTAPLTSGATDANGEDGAHATHARRSGRGALGPLVVLGIVVALGVPVGLKIKSALEARKAMDAERAKTAQAAETKAGQPRVLTTVRPVKQGWLPTVPFDGTLMAVQEVDLAFRSPGTIAKLNAKNGDRVEKGALLASLDTADLQASQAVASANVRSAQVHLSMANDNDALTTALIESGSSPAVSAVQAKGNVGLALANLEAARAQVASIGVAMRNTTIVAPFAGTITSAPTAAGGAANPGVPQFHLVDVSSLRLVGTVSELDAALVKPDAAVSIGGKAIDGAKVRVVLPTLDAATRRVPVEAIVPNDGATPLLGGSFVRASIAGGAKVDILVVPGTALRPGSQDEVFVVVKGKAAVRTIAFTRGANGELLVRSGLSESDEVVETPTADLAAGAAVDGKGDGKGDGNGDGNGDAKSEKSGAAKSEKSGEKSDAKEHDR